MKKKLLAFIIAILMVCQLGVVAFADDDDFGGDLGGGDASVGDLGGGDTSGDVGGGDTTGDVGSGDTTGDVGGDTTGDSTIGDIIEDITGGDTSDTSTDISDLVGNLAVTDNGDGSYSVNVGDSNATFTDNGDGTYDIDLDGNLGTLTSNDDGSYTMAFDGYETNVSDNNDGTYLVTLTDSDGNTSSYTLDPSSITSLLGGDGEELYLSYHGSGKVSDKEQTVFTIKMLASHYRKAIFNGKELTKDDIVIGQTSRGYLTIQFTPEFLNTLEPGTYLLVLVNQNIMYDAELALILDEDGTYILCDVY